MKPRFKLRTKIFLSFAIVASLTIIAIGFASLKVSRQALTGTVVDAGLTDAKAKAKQIEALMENHGFEGISSKIEQQLLISMLEVGLKDHRYYLFDKAGRLKFTSDNKIPRSKYKEYRVQQLLKGGDVKNTANEFSQVSKKSITVGTRIGKDAKSKAAGWYLVRQAPISVISNHLKPLLESYILILIFVVTLGIALSYLLTKSISDPLQGVMNTLTDISKSTEDTGRRVHRSFERVSQTIAKVGQLSETGLKSSNKLSHELPIQYTKLESCLITLKQVSLNKQSPQNPDLDSLQETYRQLKTQIEDSRQIAEEISKTQASANHSTTLAHQFLTMAKVDLNLHGDLARQLNELAFGMSRVRVQLHSLISGKQETPLNIRSFPRQEKQIDDHTFEDPNAA